MALRSTSAHVGRHGFDSVNDPEVSLGMLREFARRGAANEGRTPRLVHADGRRLPFRDATFDAVMLIRVIGAAQRWQRLVDEAMILLAASALYMIAHLLLANVRDHRRA